MKRTATPTTSSNAKRSNVQAKRSAMDSFTVDSTPAHHYHLGGDNYATVSDFDDAVNVHIRKFKVDDSGRIFPTKDGVSFPPFVWHSLASEIENSFLPSDGQKVLVVRDTLFLTTSWIDYTPFISLQRYVIKENLSRQFLPFVCMLSETEWDRLKSLKKKISESCKTLLISVLLKRKILSEVSSQSSNSNSQMDLSDVEIVLSTSLTETLSDHLSVRIHDVFVCDGCVENQPNQLAHDCITMNNESKFDAYGDLAILSLDFDLIAKEYIDKNIQIANYVNESFLCKLNFELLMKSAIEMYIASDR